MKHVDPPTPIMVVLNAALDAMRADERFRSVPGGRIEVAWKQARPARNGEPGSPPRYCLTLECGFEPGQRVKVVA